MLKNVVDTSTTFLISIFRQNTTAFDTFRVRMLSDFVDMGQKILGENADEKDRPLLLITVDLCRIM